MIPVTSTLSDLLLADAPLIQIEDKIRQAQPVSIFQHGLAKVAAGITSKTELTRVTGIS